MSNPRYAGPYSPAIYEAAALIIDQEARTSETRGRVVLLATAMYQAAETWLRLNPPPSVKTE